MSEAPRSWSVCSSCPRCGERSYFVVESRKTNGIQRRRRSCNSCGHKATTYEISSSDYELLRKARQVEKIFSDLSGNKDQLTCESCKHWQDGSCDFSFPEAGGAFAEECSLYKPAEDNQ